MYNLHKPFARNLFTFFFTNPLSLQINLSEYRNRARKPAERKITIDKSSSPPHTTSSLLSSPSFLSQTSLSSRPYLSSPSLSYQSTSLKLASTAGPMGATTLSGQVGGAGGSGPQFEPVSPDDDEKTPSSEGVASLR